MNAMGLAGLGRGAVAVLVVSAVALIATDSTAATIDCSGSHICRGTPADDVINGRDRWEKIFGRPGDDRIRGRGGFDTIWGREGNDVIRGGPNLDDLWGEGGDDRIFSGATDDAAGSSYQYVSGGTGNDRLKSGGGSWLKGDEGHDRLIASTSLNPDLLDGGPGDDVLEGRGNLDHYGFGSESGSWGHDTIIDSVRTDSWRASNRAHFPYATEDLQIDLIARAEQPEVEIIGQRSRIDWETNVIHWVVLGEGDDTVRGTHGDDLFSGTFGGSDSFFGRRGDDYIEARDSQYADDPAPDTIDCGGGDEDKVFYDEGVDIVVDCEILHPK